MLGARAHTSTATGPYMSTRTRTNTGTRHHTVGHRTAHPRVSLSHNMGVLPFPQQAPSVMPASPAPASGMQAPSPKLSLWGSMSELLSIPKYAPQLQVGLSRMRSKKAGQAQQANLTHFLNSHSSRPLSSCPKKRKKKKKQNKTPKTSP